MLILVDTNERMGSVLRFIYSPLAVPHAARSGFRFQAFIPLNWFKRHYQATTIAGPSLLMVMGIFLVMDRWTQLLSPLLNWYSQLNLPT